MKPFDPVHFVSILAGLALVSLGRAETITYSNTVPLSALTGEGQIKSWYHPISIPQFDPLLGQLQSVRFQLAIMSNGNLGIENPTDASLQATGSLAVLVRWSGPNFEYLVESGAYVSVGASLAPYDGITDYSGTSGTTFRNLTTGGTAKEEWSFASRLETFTGTGILSLPVAAYDRSWAIWPSLYQTELQAGAVGTVSYFYMPIPEPTTVALLAIGIAALLYSWRRQF